MNSLLLAPAPPSSHSRLLEESGDDVRPFIESNPFRPKASPDTKDENASLLSEPAAFSAAHADNAPTTSTGAAALTGNNGSASLVLEASAGAPSTPPAQEVGVVGQGLPVRTTLLGCGGGDGSGATGREGASAATPVVAVPAVTTPAAAAPAPAMKPTVPTAGAGITRHDGARVSLLDAIELVLTTGPLFKRRQAEVGEEAGAGAEARVAQESGGPGGIRAARREALGLRVIGKHIEVPVAAAVSELLKAASAAAERWDLPRREQETLKAWSAKAAASVAING